MFTDTHCHITSEFYTNIDEIVENARKNNINKLIIDADDIESCYEVIDIASRFDNVFFTLGIHPEHVDEDVSKLKEIVEDNKDNPKFVAIGEIGLDYYYTKDNKDKQLKLLEEEMILARKYNKPVIIHSREATKDTIDLLKKYPEVIGDIHCFSGSLETAREYIKMGYYIGVGGVVTFKNANIKDVIKELPIDRILLETDSPFLAPTPLRGTTNEPANVSLIADFLSEYLEINKNELSRITEENVHRLFNI